MEDRTVHATGGNFFSYERKGNQQCERDGDELLEQRNFHVGAELDALGTGCSGNGMPSHIESDFTSIAFASAINELNEIK